jgi:hypothetical protein
MDAVTRLRRVLFELLIRRPVIVCLLSLFYVFAAIAGGTGSTGPKRGLLIAVMAAIPAAGLSAVATERLVRYAASAGALGIPRHVDTLRAAQIMLFLLLVAFPWLVAIGHDAPWVSAAALLIGGSAAGTLLVGRGLLVALLIPTVWVMNAAFGPPEHWLAWSAVHYLVLAGSLAAYWRWMKLPVRVESAAPTIQVVYSDAGHEESEADMDAAGNVKPAKFAEAVRRQDAYVAAAVRGVGDGQLSPAGLALGLGFWSGTAWRAVVISAAVGILLVAAAREHYFLRQPKAVYFGLCMLAAFLALSRVSTIVQWWKRSSAEQGLLLLTPRWPSREMLKGVFLVTMARVQVGSAVGWIAISAVLLGLGWIDVNEAAYGALYVLATSLVACSYLWVALGSREVKEWQLSAIATALLTVAGVAMFQFGSSLGTLYRAAGAAACLLPPMISFAIFRLRPLQFPANPRSRKTET